MNDLDFLLKKIKKPVSIDKIVKKATRVGNYSLSDIEKYLEEKMKTYEIIKTPNGNYVPIYKTSFRVGTYKEFRNGDGIIQVSPTIQYNISKNESRDIVDGDFVMIDTYIPAGSKEKSVKVKKVLSRDLDTLVGEVIKIGENYYIEPEVKSLKKLTVALEGTDFIIGEKVVANLDKRTDSFYVANIIKTIGHKDDPGVDILMEAYKYGIDDNVSSDALEQLKYIPDKVRDADLVGRTDLRDREIFTIDSVNTKDIDDAIGYKRLDNGNHELLVSIADVTHYVTYGSPLYYSAREKATSAYLANTVIPMLPHKLSNGICSLNPNVDRLAITLRMEIDNSGNVVRHDILQSVINSNKQMNYDRVNDILEKNIVADDYEEYADTLKKMYKLSLILNRERIRRGAINLDKAEMKLIMDDDNMKVTDFSARCQHAGESLIEEFMLVANETIAEHMSKYPFIYRVHDVPDNEKLQNLINLLNYLGYDFKTESSVNAIQSLADNLGDCGCISNMLKIQLLRTFRKAKYSVDNIGHYGLASENYCHFTSPIRRFPDTTVHQLIKDFEFSNEDKEKLAKKWEKELPDIAAHSSYKQNQADECERMVLLMKCAEYMESHTGDAFEGTVIALDKDGLYVELDNMINGKVRVKDLNGEYFYNEGTYSFISMDGYDDYYLGDRLNLEVKDANKERKTINFKILGKINENDRINKDANKYVKRLKREEKYYNINKGR